MTLVKTSDRFYPAVPSFMDHFFSRDLMDWNNSNFSSPNSTLPAVNIRESENFLEIEVAAPGLKKEDFKINLDQNRLSISSEKKEEKSEKTDKFTRKEFSYSSFRRYFTVPAELVDGENITAKYNDGILVVNLPKREELKPKPAREIAIN